MMGPRQRLQRADLAAILGHKFAPSRAVPDEDDAGLPTAYCRQDRDYMNQMDDRIADHDKHGNVV